MAHENYPIYHHGRPAPLHIDPSTFERKPSDTYPTEDSDSPESSANLSPLTPSLPREESAPLTPITPDGDYDSGREPSSGPQRSRSSGSSNAKGKADKDADKEKRKRSRVTPEQLVHLERFFSIDRSPTAVRRKEISELLGMQERQTQIWFQNRRAKAKLMDGKKGRGASVETPPDTPPELVSGYEVDLHNLIHEDEPVTMIPCTDLSVGTWRRIATTVGKHDLVAYVCDTKRCLTWFIHSAGYGFKMEIPFDHIIDTQFTNAAPGAGLASFLLSEPPHFYLETVPPDGSRRVWKRCADWTEGQQATKVMKHDLIGSAVQLAHLLRNLSTSSQGSDIRLHSPSYHPTAQSSPTSIELSHSSMPSLGGHGYRRQREDSFDAHRPEYKRSYSSHSPHEPRGDIHFPPIEINTTAEIPQGPPSAGYHSYQRPAAPSHSDSYHSPMYSDYPESDSHNVSPVEYEPAHGLEHHGPRSYSGHHPSRYYDDESRIVTPYQLEELQRNPTSSTPASALGTPSPPILTTPFHPPPEILGPKPSEVITGLPAMAYESDEDVHQSPEA